MCTLEAEWASVLEHKSLKLTVRYAATAKDIARAVNELTNTNMVVTGRSVSAMNVKAALNKNKASKQKIARKSTGGMAPRKQPFQDHQ